MDRDKARRRVHIEIGHVQFDEHGKPEIIMETVTDEEPAPELTDEQLEALNEAPAPELTDEQVEDYEQWLINQRLKTSSN